MSDTHSAGSTEPAKPNIGGSMVDGWFARIVGYVSQQIRTFVAFLFFLFTLGAVFGVVIALKAPHQIGLFLLIPALMGLLAYYNTTIATVLFVVFAAFFIFLF